MLGFIVNQLSKLLDLVKSLASKAADILVSTVRIERQISSLRVLVDEQKAALDKLGLELHETNTLVQKLADYLLPGNAVKLVFTAIIDGKEIVYGIGEDRMQLKAGLAQKVILKAADKFGNLTTLDPTSPIEWASSNPENVTVVADPADSTGVTGIITSVGPVGTAQATANGDADLGPEVKPIMGVMDVQVVPGDTVMLTMEPVDTPYDPAAPSE